jgi:hypothetical protein
MQVLGGADTLDGGDLRELGDPFHLLGAGPDDLAVQDDRAGAADAGAAADFDAGEAHTPQDFSQCVVLGIAGDEPVDAVDIEAEPFQLHVQAFLSTDRVLPTLEASISPRSPI